MMAIIYDIQLANNNKYIISYLLLDVKGAFDHVLINQLIRIIVKMQLPYQIIEWTKCFMSNRAISLAFDRQKQQMRHVTTFFFLHFYIQPEAMTTIKK